MSKGHIKHMKSPILWISFTFLFVSILTLTVRNTVNSESLLLTEGLIDIKSAVIYTQKISSLTSLNLKNSQNESLKKAERLSDKYSQLLEKLKDNKSGNIFIDNSFKKIYYDEEFRIDEQFDHIEKLMKLYLKSINSSRKKEPIKLSLDIIESTQRVSLFEPFLVQKVKNQIEKINTINSIVTYTLFLLIVLLIFFMFIYIYIPWKKELTLLKDEKDNLDEELKSSEQRTKVYSWRLSTHDMSIVRSDNLSILLNGEISDRKLALNDELKLFSKKSRTKFVESLDNVLEEGRTLDIEVEVTNTGRYTYWLHYYGHYNKDKNIILGTVKDISDVRKAEQRFYKIFDYVPHPMVMILDDGIYRMNELAYKYLEISDRQKYQDTSYSLLFPMYQQDSTPSLKKIGDLKKQIAISGRAITNDITFLCANGESVTTKTELFNISYNESSALILALSGESMRHQFERRLIEANRKALHERRKKAEYIAHYNTMITHLTDLMKENFSGTEEKKEVFELKLSSIFSKVDKIWQENLAYVVDGRNNILLTNAKVLFKELTQRWHSAALRNDVDIELELYENSNYYWMDIEKVKAAMNVIVHKAIRLNTKNKIKISVSIDDIGSRYGRFNFSLIDTSGSYDFSVLESRDLNKKNSLFLVSEVIEFLQGKLITHVGSENKISFSFDVERSNRETKSHNEVIYVGEFDDKPHDITEPSDYFTFDDIIAHFGGDKKVIQSLLKDFIDYYPVIITDMLMAIREKDGDELESRASDLYGVISYFPYFKSIERVILLKKYGLFNKFDRAEDELYALISELKKFEGLVDSVLLNIKAA